MRRNSAVVLAFAVVLVLAGCSAKTTGASNITDGSATLNCGCELRLGSDVYVVLGVLGG
jgi:uncharacterized lipoprotein